jgi:K+ transporter
VVSNKKTMSSLPERIYVFLSAIAQNATDFYRIPHHKVIELGERFKV